MARRKRARTKISYTGQTRPCHQCGLLIEPGDRFRPIYGHIYHPGCWNALVRGDIAAL